MATLEFSVKELLEKQIVEYMGHGDASKYMLFDVVTHEMDNVSIVVSIVGKAVSIRTCLSDAFDLGVYEMMEEIAEHARQIIALIDLANRAPNGFEIYSFISEFGLRLKINTNSSEGDDFEYFDHVQGISIKFNSRKRFIIVTVGRTSGYQFSLRVSKDIFKKDEITKKVKEALEKLSGL